MLDLFVGGLLARRRGVPILDIKPWGAVVVSRGAVGRARSGQGEGGAGSAARASCLDRRTGTAERLRQDEGRRVRECRLRPPRGRAIMVESRDSRNVRDPSPDGLDETIRDHLLLAATVQ
ncbi:MAG: hypothetical protein U5L05_18075 [Rubrivivax sp.]|nr:hypothetical protein [Rubrivivax sp.]